MSDDLPAPDAIEGAPHPRDTAQLYGHAGAEADFIDAYTSGRMHSGWLISGPRGIGKATLAYRIAAFLLAEEPGAAPGGLFGAPENLAIPQDSPDWHQIRAGAHPRLFVLRRGPNQTGSALMDVISVGRVRELKDFFHLSAADGGRRVVIVDATDEMNNAAANALLKELEEPPARTTLLLIAHQPSRLLPTIRSRCRALRLSPLSPLDMGHALTQAGFGGEGSEALAALAEGSVGDAIRLIQHDGLTLYSDLAGLFAQGARINRDRAVKLADTLSGRGADARFRLACDLLAGLAARAARSGLVGPPAIEATEGEARLLARLAPHDAAARDWAALATDMPARLRAGRAVNVETGALILDALLELEAVAQRHAA